MPKKAYITRMPDKSGALLLAAKIISNYNGNITRVSYNKAVDLHTLFIDVTAEEDNLNKITNELALMGYLKNSMFESRVLVVVIKIPNVSGAVLPVLKVLNLYDINISYINSVGNDEDEYQNFKMGLFIEKPEIIRLLLRDIGEIYPIDIEEYDDSETILDNTIFYIRLANKMKDLLGLSSKTTLELITASNQILQSLEASNENPDKVFSYIRRMANFINLHQGDRFKANIESIDISPEVKLHSIQPPCGSNTYILEGVDEIVLIDTGFAIYAKELEICITQILGDWKTKLKKVYITHADVDHCGMLSQLQNIKIYLNRKSAKNFIFQLTGHPDYREKKGEHFGYSRLSRIISNYIPPSPDLFEIIEQENIPEEHDKLITIGKFTFKDITFNILEGSGGHLPGEMIFVSPEYGIIFTGDNLVNVTGFSEETLEFNMLAPYLMQSVNVDSAKANDMRKQLITMIKDIQCQNVKPCLICGGHGSLFKSDEL